MVATDQSKSAYCEATLAEYMHRHSICPGNHIIGYSHGWYNIDDRTFQDPQLTSRAQELKESDSMCVGFSRTWNCHVPMEIRE